MKPALSRSGVAAFTCLSILRPDAPAPKRPDSKEDPERNYEGDGDRNDIGHAE